MGIMYEPLCVINNTKKAVIEDYFPVNDVAHYKIKEQYELIFELFKTGIWDSTDDIVVEIGVNSDDWFDDGYKRVSYKVLVEKKKKMVHEVKPKEVDKDDDPMSVII